MITIRLPGRSRITVKGELAVLYGTGPTASKRPLNPAQPMAPSAGRGTGKDALTPILAQLTERYLANAADKNELDQAFQAALARHPGVKRQLLEQFVAGFKAIPESTKRIRFVRPTAGVATTARISTDDARQALISARPALTEKIQSITVPRVVMRMYPHINELQPTVPVFGYNAGQQLSIVGRGFSSTLADNSIEIWPDNPEANAATYHVTPQSATSTELTFKVPQNIAPGLWRLHVNVKNASSNQVSLRVKDPALLTPVEIKPKPVITSITPSNAEPGQWVYINGQNFQPGADHWIRMNYLSLPDPHTWFTAGDVISATQLKVKIPSYVLAGLHGFQVFTLHVPISDAKTYTVGTPQYRVVFTRMKCLDESDPEWCGSDEIVTFWAAVADGMAYKKNTDEYTGLDDGDTKNYKSSDKNVLQPNGLWASAKYGVGLTTQLYEWDAGDVAAAQEFVGFIGDVASAVIGAIFGESVGGIIGDILDFLGDVIGWIASWFGGEPDFLGETNEYWTGPQLQQMLSPAQSQERTLNFSNNDDTGSYRLYYMMYRQ